MSRPDDSSWPGSARIWFDVEDLIDFAERHARPTGIQRVCYEMYRAAWEDPLLRARIGFVRHAGGGERGFVEADWAQLAARFQSITDRPADALPPVPESIVESSETARVAAAPSGSTGRVRGIVRRLKRVVPERVARPGLLFAVMQVQAGLALGSTMRRIASHRVRNASVRSLDRLRRGKALLLQREAPPPVETEAPRPPRRLGEIARRGDILVVLGSPWFELEYGELAGFVRGRLGLRLAVLVHDVIPVRRPEWVDRGTVRVFRNWYRTVLPLADLVLANSRATAADMESWCARDGIPLAGPAHVLPLGTGFGPDAAKPGLSTPLSLPGPLLLRLGRRPYVLCVGTIEARKNHLLLFRAWRRLMDEMGPERVPDLVFAGKVGWLVNDLMNQIENSRNLDGKLHVIQGLDDASLRALYDNCLFTVFPSFYEGWGLPVSESLAAGAPCICSNTTSLPEAGGTLARYFDPFDLDDAVSVIGAAIQDRQGLAEWRARVKRDFVPVGWDRTVASLREAVDALA
ncbi:glycosyltransferase family 4 protein [Acetobacteraceae bacterium KSS8]|uniref:Glycosyltransferase family 4 protein n=1 Tax=Endosaccharibacter trunci TaxID=2812733 RepID=A0ABT1W5C3_9PROT|nr:glycosyltransferase family 4 protein [Acetobacteraceae bacterium KSS8]